MSSPKLIEDDLEALKIISLEFGYVLGLIDEFTYVHVGVSTIMKQTCYKLWTINGKRRLHQDKNVTKLFLKSDIEKIIATYFKKTNHVFFSL